jgi:DMSO reductase anchor subunit
MKIYLLMMLIGAIVGLSHLSHRVRAKQAAPTPPDSLPA